MKRKTSNRGFKMEVVKLIPEKGYRIAEASRSLGVEYSVLRSREKQLTEDPASAFPGKGRLKPQDDEIHHLKKELQRTKEERDILKKAPACFAEDQK
jgi:transposase